MTLRDAVMQMQERPDLLAISPLGQICRLGPSGFLLPALTKDKGYSRFRATELLAVTWVVYTADQLRQMADQEQAG